MRKANFFTSSCYLSFPFFGQAQINCGSSNGNYLTIRGTKLYYEEYGKGTPLLMSSGIIGGMEGADEYFPKRILEALNIPVLVVYGDHDVITLSHGIEIKNAIKNSQFCILPNHHILCSM